MKFLNFLMYFFATCASVVLFASIAFLIISNMNFYIWIVFILLLFSFGYYILFGKDEEL